MEEKQEEKKSIKMQVGVAMLSFAIVLLCFTTFRIIPGIQDFFLGVFGIMLYPLILFVLLFGLALALNLKFVYSPKYIVYLFLCFFFFMCVVHIIFTGFGNDMTYGQYLGTCYTTRFTPGGLIVGLFTFPITSLLHQIAGIVLYAIALVISIYFVVSYLESLKEQKGEVEPKSRYQTFETMSREVEFDNLFAPEEKSNTTTVQQTMQLDSVTPTTPTAKEKLLSPNKEEEIFINDESKPKEEPKDEIALAREKLGLTQKAEEPKVEEPKAEEPSQAKLFVNSESDPEWQMRAYSNMNVQPQKFVYSEPKKEEPKPLNPLYEKDREYLSTILSVKNNNKNPIISGDNVEEYHEQMRLFNEQNAEENVVRQEPKAEKPAEEKFKFDIEPERPQVHSDSFSKIEEVDFDVSERQRESVKRERKLVTPSSFTQESFEDSLDNSIEPDDDFIIPETFENNIISKKDPDVEIKNTPDLDFKEEDKTQRFMDNPSPNNDIAGSLGNTVSLDTKPHNFNFEVINGPGPQKQVEPDFKYGDYVRPPLDLLKTYVNEEDTGADIPEKSQALESVLESFNIPAKVENVTRGAAVTRFELRMPTGITVKRVETHAQDITLALAASKDVRIEAPIKGKSAVGIEVPNAKVDIVGLKDIIDSPQFSNSRSPLLFALGKDVDGTVRCCNLDKMPHLLVAGSTNSGKSSCLNSLLISMIYHTTPNDLRLVLVDPKQVEFTTFNGLPHLLTPNTITDMKKVIPALDWIIGEMERRYTLLRDNRVKNLEEYNDMSDVKSGKKQKLPYIVLIVDEFADVILTVNRKEFEERIQRIAQKARAAGIHLILATQRPSVDVISGVIKTNLPSQIAFAVTRATDSITILGQGGAENLLGRGDMLYAPMGSEPMRVQGCWVSTPEINDIVDYVKANNPGVFDKNIENAINGVSAPQGGGSYNATPAVDSYMPEALKLVIETGQASSSMLQRRFAIGFQRASKIIDQMEQAGFIAPNDGSNKPRAVYITMEDFYKIYPNN